MADKDSQEVPIPQPPLHWLTKNLPDIDFSNSIASTRRLAKLYGPILKLDLGSRKVIYVSSRDLVDEVCDDKRFQKTVTGPLFEVRHVTGTGLFTSFSDEHDWKIAHKLLMPVFGPLGIQKMFPEMLDLTSQMLMKWQRLGENALIDPIDSFTRLTLDTIALCSFDYRFNSFYTNEMHPFVTSALDALLESGRRAGRTQLETKVRAWSQQKYDEHIHYCWKLCDDIVAERKANPREVNDLLNVMLNAQDPETGEKMTPELIRFEMMTFLIAGHDTTSGLLCFAFLSMLQHPRTLHLAQAEVDRVLGDGPITVKHHNQLPYIEAVMRETLRLYPTAPFFSRHSLSKEDTFIGGGKYRIQPDDNISINLSEMHRDVKVWGEDAEEFKPERMLNGGWEKLPPNSWKPFGNGDRSCIGRAFAWQEAWMAIALILQRFQVELAEPNYKIHVRQTLTQKPTGWHMKCRLRTGKDIYSGIVPEHTPTKAGTSQLPIEKSDEDSKNPPLTLVYGSNQGTCKTFAETLQAAAPAHGFNANLITLDTATENLPTDRPVVFFTPSYEGQPPDNGKKFVAWLEANASDKSKLKGVKYAVFGAGNPDWISTFQRIPKLVDSLMEEMGAERIVPTVLGNVAQDIFGDFDEFCDKLWSTVSKTSGKGPVASTETLKVDFTLDRPELLGEKDITLASVTKHTRLADNSVGPEKKLLEVQLPDDTHYQAGDYLVVLPSNHQDDVNRVLKRFKVPADALLKLSGTRKTFLPHEHPEDAFNLIAAYVEIGTIASKKQIQALADATKDSKQKSELEKFSSGETYEKEVLAKRASVIDILETFPASELSFAAYLDMLQPMKPRQYSIASSPLAMEPGHACVLYDVVQGPSFYNKGVKFYGVGSSYLSQAAVGGKVHAYIKPTQTNFRLPADPATPVIMICAGTGLAPMRAFIQERAAIAAVQNIKFGPGLLYFGCRHHEKDYICGSELKDWEAKGVVEVRPTFSQEPAKSGGHKYVPDRLWADRDELVKLFRQGARIMLCGSASKLAKSTNEVLEKIVMEFTGKDEKAAKEWLTKQKADRYVTDIFG